MNLLKIGATTLRIGANAGFDLDLFRRAAVRQRQDGLFVGKEMHEERSFH